MLVYSIADRSSFEEIVKWRQMVIETRRSFEKEGESYSTLVVGAKCDLEAARVVSREEGLALATSLGCGFMECSAKEKKNVDEVFVEVAREYMRCTGSGAADVFALVVFLCDGLLRLKWRLRMEADKYVRFFKIARSLPLELQMVLSQRAMQSMRNRITGKEVNGAFLNLALFYHSRNMSALERRLHELLGIFE